jgi:uncharacterized delta-60 repeat protein
MNVGDRICATGKNRIWRTVEAIALVAMMSQISILLISANSAFAESPPKFALAQYSSSGTADTTFSGDGKQLTDLSTSSQEIILDIAIDSSGKIVAGGSVTVDGSKQLALARYTSSGTLDTTFDGDGTQLTKILGTNGAADIAIDGSNRVVVVSAAKRIISVNPLQLSNVFSLARYTSNGVLDSTCDGDGIVYTNIASSTSEEANAVAIEPTTGKIVVGGFATTNGMREFALARYNPADCSLDKTFSGDGIQRSNISSPAEQILDIAIDSNGKIVAAGYSTSGSGDSRFTFIRYTSTGNPDTTCGPNANGIKVTSIAGSRSSTAYSVAITPVTGKIVLAGEGNVQGELLSLPKFALARYNSADCSLDTTFSGDGMRLGEGPLSNLIGHIEDIAVDSSEKIVAVGLNRVVRYTTTGGLDSNFSGDGIVEVSFPGNNNTEPLAVAIKAKNVLVPSKIVVGGSASYVDPPA